MRENKFRAWDKKEKKMYLPVWSIFYYDDSIGIDVFGLGRKEEDLIFDCVLMQYTELKDKNGNEIYEGDIFNLLQSETGEILCPKNVVELADFLGGHYYKTRMGGSTVYEIIGNIYENPELMKGEDK